MEGYKDTTESTVIKTKESQRELDSPSEASSSGISSQKDSPDQIPEQTAEDGHNDETYQAKLQQGLMAFSQEETKGASKNTTKSESPGKNGGEGGNGEERKNDDEDGGGPGGLYAEEQLKKPLPDVLNDVAKFAYSSLVAVCLPNLFEMEWNRQWNMKVVKSLSKYLKLPKQSEEVFSITVEDPNHHDLSDADVFTKALLEEPSLIKPEIIPQDIITHALQDGTYDARMRVLVREISKRLKVSWKTIRDFEKGIINIYEQEEHELTEEERREREKKAKFRKVKRYFMIGAATVGGGALIGLTGGLAAPLIAVAGGALLGTSLSFFTTVAGAAIIGSVLGAAGAGLSGYKMKKRVGEVEEFNFSALTEGKDLHVTVAISGWLQKDRLDNFTAPWHCVATCNEIYCLKWESKYLLALGDALEYILDTAMSMAAKEALKYTVLAGLLAAIALPATAYAAISNTIDNPWSIVTSRASEAGKQLAEVLLSRQQGKRPVTLIGFSMGARVIFFCLKELAQRKNSEGIIQDVYLLGAPVTSSVVQWKPFARVVAGHIVNGYCRGDWLLQFVYRTASMQVSDIAGLEPVKWKNRRMVNVDITDVVTGHLDYSDKIATILDYVGLETKEIPKSKSGNLSDLSKSKAKEKPKKVSEDDPLAVKIDASDLLLPKSGSAMDLALAKLTGKKGSSQEEADPKPKTLAENVAHSHSMDKMSPSGGASCEGAETLDKSHKDAVIHQDHVSHGDNVSERDNIGHSEKQPLADGPALGAEGGGPDRRSDGPAVGAEGGGPDQRSDGPVVGAEGRGPGQRSDGPTVGAEGRGPEQRSDGPVVGAEGRGPGQRSDGPAVGAEGGGPDQRSDGPAVGAEGGGPDRRSDGPAVGAEGGGPDQRSDGPAVGAEGGGPDQRSDGPAVGAEGGGPDQRSDGPAVGAEGGGPDQRSDGPAVGAEGEGPEQRSDGPAVGAEWGGPDKSSDGPAAGAEGGGPDQRSDGPAVGTEGGGPEQRSEARREGGDQRKVTEKSKEGEGDGSAQRLKDGKKEGDRRKDGRKEGESKKGSVTGRKGIEVGQDPLSAP